MRPVKIARIFFFLFTVCFILPFPSYAKKIIILGDSLTEGYGVTQDSAFPVLLQKKMIDDKIDWTLVGSGSSGSTTASGVSRMKWLIRQKPDFIFVILGSNDGLRGLKAEETEKNLNETIQYGLKNNIQIILGQLHVPPNYGKQYSKQFSDIYPRVAKKNKVLLAPFLLENVAGIKDLNLADGIHPNEKGHKKVADNLYPFLKNIMTAKTASKEITK